MADETLQQQPPTFSDELYKYAHDSGFIPKEATFDIFKKNLLNKDFVKELYDYSVQTDFIPKEATIDIFIKNLGGVEPSKKKDATVSSSAGVSSGLPKTDPYATAFAGKQQAAIDVATSPAVKTQVDVKRTKKFPDFTNSPISTTLNAYKDLKSAAQNTSNAQSDYENFLGTGAVIEGGQELRPLGAMPTDVLGTTAIVEGSPAAQVKKDLENKVKVAKQKEDIAYSNLAATDSTFKNKPAELPRKKELGGDKYEYEMPAKVKVLDFMQDMSNLENHATDLGMSLKQYSDSVESISSDAFLSPEQQGLFKALNSGDEKTAKAAIASYDEDINKQIDGINKMLASGIVPPDQRGKWINERQTLIDQKSDFFNPKKAIQSAIGNDAGLAPVFDAFKGIGDQDKASLVYAKTFKESQDLANNLLGEPLFIDDNGKQVLNPKIENYLVGGQNSPFRQKNADQREQLQKNINTLKLLAPATLLNRRPLEKKGSFIESFGKTLAKGIGFDTGFTETMVETDKPSVVANFLADATVSTKDLPLSQSKQLEDIGKQNNWEFAGSTLGYLIPAGVELSVGGGELKAARFITSALKRTSTAADLAYDVIKLTKGSGVLNKAIKLGAEAQLGGWTFGDKEMGFANIGAEGLTGELFEKALKKLPAGALIGKVANKAFGKNAAQAMGTISKMNAYGLAETAGEGVGTLVQLYQDSPTWKEFEDKFKQQFGSAEENLKFFLSCYTLGSVMGNHAAPATKAVMKQADQAYQALSPQEKVIADQVIENDVDATNTATVNVVRNTVDKVPDTNLSTLTETVAKAKEDIDNITEVSEENPYEIKVGDITLSGNTPEQLANDKDLINSLDLIYSGEQQRRKAEGITVETPPIAKADTGDVELAKPEAGVGVEGKVVPEDVQKKIAELEDMLSRDALSMQETGQRTLVDRQAVVDELADLKKKYNIEPKPIAKAAPTFENVPVFTYTPQDVEKAKNEVFDNLSKLQVGSVIENSDGEIKVVTENSTDKKGNTLIGVVTFTRLEDGSLLQTSNPVFASKSADGKIKLDYNPHTTGRNAKDEQVTVTDQITDKTIDLSKENIFIEDENGNLVKTNAFSTTTAQTATEILPQEVQDKKAEIERRRQEELKPYDERDAKSLEAVMPNNPNHPIFKVGMKFNQGMRLQIVNTVAAENYDGRENAYEAITKIVEPAKIGKDGKMTKAAKVEVTLFNTKEDADAAIQEKYEKVKSRVGKKQKEINAKYDAELSALETTKNQPQEGAPEPTKAPVIKAQVVGTTNGFNTIIDGGLGKQQDPRFTGEVLQGKSIFKVNPNNNESSFLDISLPSTDSFGRSGGVQIRFELPNGVDANTVFEAVKKEAANLGQLDAKDPDFKSKVQGLVDKGISEIQGLATGGAGQTAQVKETVEEKQVGETTKLEEGDILTPEEYDKLDKFIKEEERKAGSEYPSLSYKEEFIHKNIGRVDAQQLIDGVGEKVFKDGKMALRFTKKGGQPIDDAAIELSNMAGVEITPQDIFDYFVDRTVKGNRYVKQKAKNYKAAESIGKAKQSLIDSGFQYAANSVENVDELLNPDFIESLRGFPLTDEETDAILETIKKANTDENFKNGLKEQLSNVVSIEKTRSSIVGGQEETTATPKIDETTESPTTVTVDTGTVENAPTQAPIAPTQIEGLINGGTKRTAALESIEDTQVKEVAKKLTQPKFFDTIYAKIDLDDPMLLELQEKLGFKKICE